MQKNILIVEDERKLNHLIKESLTTVGYNCFQAFYGMEALRILEAETLDIIILDVQLPDVNGFKLIKSIKDVPVIFLTAKDSIENRVTGLNLGAEDYIVKPFALDELLARIHVVLRRKDKETIFSVSNLVVDLNKKRVTLGGKNINLTPQEYSLLEVFILNKNIALSREQLINQAWEMDFLGEDRTVDVHVQRLRKKLFLEDYLKTIFKFGYRLEVE